MKQTLFLLVALLMTACGANSQTKNDIDDDFRVQTEDDSSEMHCCHICGSGPEFPGGENALYAFIDSVMRYPEEALEYHIEGRIYLTFVIEKNGYAHDAKVLVGLPGGCNEAAIELVRRMPRWTPEKQRDTNGEYHPVRTQFNLPINFKLDPQSPRRSWSYQDTSYIHYPGGTDALYRYLSANIDYPRKYWTSKVDAEVTFDGNGNVEHVRIATQLPDEHQKLAEAIRKAILSMPRWVGKQNMMYHLHIPIDLPLLASMHDTLLRPSYFEPTDLTWKMIVANEAYFRQLLAVNDSLVAGYTVPAKRLQALMPRDESHYHTLCGLDYYIRNGYGFTTLTTMAEYAVRDSLDMMERFVHWFNWTDGYVAETVFDYGIQAEQRHKKKFRRLMHKICPDQWEAFVEWRNTYFE